MTVCYHEGESLEGAACLLYTRKHNNISTLVRHPLTERLCMKTEMCWNSSAEISKELDPNIKREKIGILVDAGDKLQADAISVWVDQKRPIKFKVEEGMTHRHGGHLAATQNTTFCKIKKPFDHILKAVIKQLSGSNKQIEA